MYKGKCFWQHFVTSNVSQKQCFVVLNQTAAAFKKRCFCKRAQLRVLIIVFFVGRPVRYRGK